MSFNVESSILVNIRYNNTKIRTQMNKNMTSQNVYFSRSKLNFNVSSWAIVSEVMMSHYSQRL